MPRLKIDTKKSLYDPIEVEIDGKIFPVKKINRETIQQIQKFDEETGNGNIDAAYQRLELFIGKHDVIAKLALEDLIEITNFIVTNLFRPKKKEKNLQRSGDKKLQS